MKEDRDKTAMLENETALAAAHLFGDRTLIQSTTISDRIWTK